MDKNTQQQASWEYFDGTWHVGVDGERENYEMFGYPTRDLYTAPPVPRDVLVLLSRWEAFGKAMLKAGSILPRNLVADTESALADRYASQVQTEQPYAADAAMEGMKRLGYRWENGAWYKKGDTQPEPSLTDRQIKHMLALETALSKLIDKVAPGLLLDGDILAEAEEALRIADARNPVVTSGYLCVDCGALFSAADHSQAQPEPFETQHDMFAQAGDEQAAEGEQLDASAFVMELAKHTAMQFEAMAEKVGVVASAVQVAELRKGFEDFSLQLRNVAANLEQGHFDDALLNADWSAMGMADKAIALASHAGVALIFGNEAMGTSVLREAAE